MVIIVIQARLNSTRLPNKVLLPIGKSSCLVRIIRTAKGSKLANEVIVVCPDDNGTIADICRIEKVGLSEFRPSERNVLAEFWHARNWQDTDTVVRITADCPLLELSEIDNGITFFLTNQSKFDYYYNNYDGSDVQIFSGKTLKETFEKAKNPDELEHVCIYMERNLRSYIVQPPRIDSLSLNTKNDYDKIIEICWSLRCVGH